MRAAGLRPATAPSDPGYEAFFWLAFRKSKNPMWIRDPDRVLVDVNDAALERFGYTRDDLVGTRTEKLVAPSDRKRLESDWRALLRTGTPSQAQLVAFAFCHGMLDAELIRQLT